MANVRFSGQSDFERVKKDYDDLARKTAKVELENRKLRQQSEAAARAGRSQHREQEQQARRGADSLRILETVGHAAFATLTAAAAGYMRVMAEVREATDAAGAALQGRVSGMGPLGQLAATPADRKRLTEQAEEIFTGGATASGGQAGLVEAGNLAFSLESAGLLGERQTFIEAGASRLFDPAALPELAKAFSALEKAMGRDEVGSVRDVLSKGLIASAVNPEDVPSLIVASAGAGASAKQMGVGDEQLLAGVATAAGVTGSAAQAGTQAEAFFKSLAVADSRGEEFTKLGLTLDNFKNKSIGEMIDLIESAGLNEGELIKFFGRMEGFKFFSALQQNRQSFESLVKDTDAANRVDVFGQRVAQNLEDPDILIDQRARQAAARQELERIDLGRVKRTADIVQAEKVAGTREAYGDFMAGAVSLGGKAMRRLFGDDALLRQTNLQMLDPEDRTLVGTVIAEQDQRRQQLDTLSVDSFAYRPNTGNSFGAVGAELLGSPGEQNTGDQELRDLSRRQLEQQERQTTALEALIKTLGKAALRGATGPIPATPL